MDQSPIIFIGHWNDTMSLDIVKKPEFGNKSCHIAIFVNENPRFFFLNSIESEVRQMALYVYFPMFKISNIGYLAI